MRYLILLFAVLIDPRSYAQPSKDCTNVSILRPVEGSLIEAMLTKLKSGDRVRILQQGQHERIEGIYEGENQKGEVIIRTSGDDKPQPGDTRKAIKVSLLERIEITATDGLSWPTKKDSALMDAVKKNGIKMGDTITFVTKKKVRHKGQLVTKNDQFALKEGDEVHRISSEIIDLKTLTK